MRVQTIEIYTFVELSESAQETAIDRWRETSEFFWLDEWIDSLKAFCDTFNLQSMDYSIGLCSPSWASAAISSWDERDTGEIDNALRLRAWVINNWLPHVERSKYLGTVKGKPRYSRVQREISCPFTGYCGDMDLLDPMIEFANGKSEYTTLQGLVDDCLSSWVSGVVNDMEWQQSDEYIREHIDANGYEFYADGSMA